MTRPAKGGADVGPLQFEAGRFQFRSGEVAVETRLLVVVFRDQILLEGALLPGVLGLGAGEPEFGLLEGEPPVAGVHPGQHRAGGDRGALPDPDLGDDAGGLGEHPRGALGLDRRGGGEVDRDRAGPRLHHAHRGGGGFLGGCSGVGRVGFGPSDGFRNDDERAERGGAQDPATARTIRLFRFMAFSNGPGRPPVPSCCQYSRPARG